MTEINIQRKSGTAALWWILGVIAVLLLAWYLFAGGTREAALSGAESSSGPVAIVLVDPAVTV